MDARMPACSPTVCPHYPIRAAATQRPERLDRLLSMAAAWALGLKALLFLWMIAFLLSGHLSRWLS